MEDNEFSVSLANNPLISMKAIPGHYTTSHFHITHYLDVSDLKTNAMVAKEVARELAVPYISNELVDTIVCLEGTEVIGAFMADELSQEGTSIINSGGEIHVITPIRNVNGNLAFQSSRQEYISEKNIVLLVASISSGRTMRSAMECISYYGGVLVGVSALFNAYPDKTEQEINAMFTEEDIPDYHIFTPEECPMCRKGQKLDAIVTSEGYTIL